VQAGARTLSEVFSTTASDAGILGFVTSTLPATTAPILWVQDHMSQAEAGRPYLPGLSAERTLIHITLPRAADVLWARSGVRLRFWISPPQGGWPHGQRPAIYPAGWCAALPCPI
jgi:hypothetical protein